ncbi:DUF4118 domain-containing protein [Nostoc sp. CENA67]|uniref:histidine kinase n=1 Tax=Amazonocrinis nigriterrae CENA67 TaxID=2794033 RepID=A0A8J7L8D4_9NOST|nr:histidine kinase dimerization/phospho-acceptor domain-containing protein [Amazonocrinis nigriterrae]MBH8563243.1 DUF4118 domain-containing protein [Amazonocrinis nigriterrae CENA67]
MQNANHSWQLQNYGIAVLASTLALLFSLLISPLLENVSFSMFFAAVVFSSWYGSHKSGLIATLLCSLAIVFFFLQPAHLPYVVTLDGIIRLGLFAAVSLFTNELNAARKRAELRLQESENRYRQMVEAVQDYAIYKLDPQGRIVTCNAGIERIQGDTAKEILGQHFFRFYTEQKQAEAALYRSNQRLATLQAIDHAILRAESPEQIAQAALERLINVIACQQAAVILFNFNTNEAQILAGQIAGNNTGGVVAINQLTAVEMVRYREPILYIEDIATWSDRTPALEYQFAIGSRSFLAVALRVEGNLIGDLTLFANEPAAFDLENQAIATEIANQLAIAIQQSRLREQLQNYANELEQRVTERTAALVEANSELETFGYSVSHDLRAPLRSVQGLAQALQEDYGDQLDSDGQEYIQRIVASAERMDGLIQDLLNYSRLSRAEMKLRILNLTEIVTYGVGQLESELRSRQAQITIEQPFPEVRGHYTTLMQVIVNLLSNAIKFVPPNRQPQIRIWAEMVEVLEQGSRGAGENLQQISPPIAPLSNATCSTWGNPKTLRVQQSPIDGNRQDGDCLTAVAPQHSALSTQHSALSTQHSPLPTPKTPPLGRRQRYWHRARASRANF